MDVSDPKKMCVHLKRVRVGEYIRNERGLVRSASAATDY